jgi:hypothetical protein
MRSIGAGARERGAPESPVFCAAKNVPKQGVKTFYIYYLL